MITEEPIRIGSIPAIRIFTEAPARGAVVFYHGWTSTKELQTLRGRILASYGYDVLLPEAVNHGERGVIDYEGAGAYDAFWQTIFRNVEEAPQILDYMQQWRPGVPLAVMGHSMGGITALGVMAQQPSYATAVSMNGSGWWDESERRFRSALHLARPDDFTELLEKLHRYDPYTHVEAVAHRSVLALNGGDDPTVDREAQHLFMEKLARQGNVTCRSIVYPGLGHFVTTNMMADAVHWLDEQLG